MRSRSGTGGGGSFGVQMNGTWTEWGVDRWGNSGVPSRVLEFEDGEWVNKDIPLKVGNTDLEGQPLETQSGTQLAGLFFKSGGWLDGGRFVWRISGLTDAVNTDEEMIADRRLTRGGRDVY
eukprot:60477_1